MSTGKSPSGTTTTQTVNPTQQAQLPFLTGAAGSSTANGSTDVGWNQAYNLSVGDPFTYYPGTTLAPYNPAMSEGYNSQINNGQYYNSAILPSAQYGAMGGYGMQNSPAAPGLSDIGYGTNPLYGDIGASVNTLNTIGGQAMANPYLDPLAATAASAGQTNTGLDELQKTASGYYLNSNPYVDDMYDAAASGVTRQYQTATAPQTASNYSTAGRYGSGAYANSVSQNQQDLGTSLDNLSSNIYGTNYANERAQQEAAANSYNAALAQQAALQGQLYGTAGSQYLAGTGQAANDAAQAAAINQQNLALQNNALNTMQSGYQAGNTATIQSQAMYPSLMNAGSTSMVTGGQGLTAMDQAAINDQMNRYYGEQYAPWQTNQMYLNQIGQPTTGSGSTTSPYFTNDVANILGAGMGGLSLYNGMNTAGLFGTGTSAAVAPSVMGTFGEWSPLATTAAPTASKGMESTLPFMMKA